MGKRKHKVLHRKRKDSFTLVETMIVLAIAAVILTIVLLTVPAARRTQRDSQRKTLAQQIITAQGEFKATFHKVPGCDNNCTAADIDTVKTFISNYVPGIDPSTGDPYASEPLTVNAGNDIRTSNDSLIFYYNGRTVNHNIKPAWPGQVLLATGHWCYSSAPDGLNTPVAGTDQRTQVLVILVGTERNDYYCIDNY